MKLFIYSPSHHLVGSVASRACRISKHAKNCSSRLAVQSTDQPEIAPDIAGSEQHAGGHDRAASLYISILPSPRPDHSQSHSPGYSQDWKEQRLVQPAIQIAVV